jgi:hypothetical protein
MKTTRNVFDPLRDLVTEEAPETGIHEEDSEISQRFGKDRINSIIITTQINMLKFQGEIKSIAKGSFEFRNTKNGTRVIVREMAEYLAIKSQLEKKKILFYAFHHKTLKRLRRQSGIYLAIPQRKILLTKFSRGT